jgi:tRNA A-37 threonylcarbamoyl transferase component Bud32
MACLDEQSILRYVDGTLAPAEREEAQEHVARCSECRAVVSELARNLTPARTALGGLAAPLPLAATELAPPSEEPPLEGRRFVPGELLAERYRVTRFVAAGAMGEVYEAQDLELGVRIALKCVHPEIAADRRMIERFKRETYFARKVTHANVCRIFDVGFHTATRSDGSRERIAFLTMEFLDGESLAARLERGRMTTAEALPLVTQMAAALSSAHQAGIVHRDFKSANVMLVGSRAVVTDFGLARGSAEDGRFVASTLDRGGLVGTPAYMAPEQVAGQEVGPAADIYALGVVMFEMVTGRWPFVAETAMLTAVKRLHEDAPSPRTLVPDVDSAWEAAILRCLRREPGERFAGADELTRALAGNAPAKPVVRRRRRWIYVALVAAGVIAAGLGVQRAVSPRARSSIAAPPPVTPPPIAPAVTPAPATTPVPHAKPKHPAATKRTKVTTDPLITDYPQ